MENHYLKHKERLRTRFTETGLEGFHDYEVLELLLSYSLVQRDTKELAKKMINHFGNISYVFNASVEELCKFNGISKRTAILLKAVKESASFMLLDRIKGHYYIRSSEDVRNYLLTYYKGEKIETFIAFYLNSKNMIISVDKIASGTTNEARIYLRTIVEDAIKKGASAVIAVHNHPSGSTDISYEDIKLTRKLKEILKIVDVRLLDHIIVGGNECISMNDKKLL